MSSFSPPFFSLIAFRYTNGKAIDKYHVQGLFIEWTSTRARGGVCKDKCSRIYLENTPPVPASFCCVSQIQGTLPLSRFPLSWEEQKNGERKRSDFRPRKSAVFAVRRRLTTINVPGSWTRVLKCTRREILDICCSCSSLTFPCYHMFCSVL